MRGDRKGVRVKPSREVLLYRAPDGGVRLEVELRGDTVWLNLNQLAELFGRDKSVISRHLRNLYREKELEERATVAQFATVQREGGRRVERQVEHYNLDAIISVGYRVNSRRGTQFRIWATQVLRRHLIQGYTLNEKRLREQGRRLEELQQAIRLVGRVLDDRALATEEATGLLRVIADYSRALSLLDQYDHQRVAIGKTTPAPQKFVLTYDMAMRAVERLRERTPEPSSLFGAVKDASLDGAIATIYQTFGGRELYPSIEEKAAHLLYFVIKDHPFVDGNKRIGAFLFLWFLDAHGILYGGERRKRIADNALVALTLLIAESNPLEKDILIKLVVNLIDPSNRGE